MSEKITEINGLRLQLDTPNCPQNIGYNIFDINTSLSMRVANKNKKLDRDNQIAFIDTLALLKKSKFYDGSTIIKPKSENEMSNEMLKALSKSDILVMGATMFEFEKTTARFSFLVSILNSLEKTSAEYNKEYKRLIMPITFGFTDRRKNAHVACLCIDRDGDNRNIFMLEQHSGADYTKKDNNDYSEDVGRILKFVERTYTSNNIMDNANSYTNKSPYCTERKVCGIATLALIDKLMDINFKINVDDENNIEVDNLQISANDIRKTHKQNILYARKHQNQQRTITLDHLPKKAANVR